MTAPETHHIDRRAHQLIPLIESGDPGDLFDTYGMSALLGVSPGWLNSGRVHGFGPPPVRLKPRKVRYRRADVLAWLRGRMEVAV